MCICIDGNSSSTSNRLAKLFMCKANMIDNCVCVCVCVAVSVRQKRVCVRVFTIVCVCV